MSKGPRNPKPATAPISKREKQRRFWEHGFNPITGFRDPYTERNSGTGIIETKPDINVIRKNNNF